MANNKIADSLLKAKQDANSRHKTFKSGLIDEDAFKDVLAHVAAEKAQSGLHAHQVTVTIGWENDQPIVEGVDVHFAEV